MINSERTYKPASDKLKDLLKSVEKLSLKPYLDAGGIPTIGYGNTYYENGVKVKMSDAPISLERAEELFNNVLRAFEDAVNKVLTIQPYQWQLDAFVMMAYNCGIPKFITPCKVVECYNNLDLEGVKSWWLKSFITVNGVESKGLINRRKCELDIFDKNIYRKW